jgi:hypothetical protein
MDLTNNIHWLALDRLIQTLPNLHQFPKIMDYCTISGLLMNVSSGEYEKILRLQAKTLAKIMRQAWPPQSKKVLLSPLNESNPAKFPLLSQIV